MRDACVLAEQHCGDCEQSWSDHSKVPAPAANRGANHRGECLIRMSAW